MAKEETEIFRFENELKRRFLYGEISQVNHQYNEQHTQSHSHTGKYPWKAPWRCSVPGTVRVARCSASIATRLRRFHSTEVVPSSAQPKQCETVGIIVFFSFGASLLRTVKLICATRYIHLVLLPAVKFSQTESGHLNKSLGTVKRFLTSLTRFTYENFDCEFFVDVCFVLNLFYCERVSILCRDLLLSGSFPFKAS